MGAVESQPACIAVAPDESSEEMTPEEAERLLQLVRDKERQRQEELARRRAKDQPRVVRDW